MGPCVEVMLTIYSSGSAPMNKIAAIPIYDKTLKNLLFSTKKALMLDRGIQHWPLNAYQVC